VQTILLVEANRASPLRDALRNEGYRVLTAHSVFEAVEEAMDFTGDTFPDLILMDMDDSAKNDLSMLGSLRAESRWQQIPLVAISGDKALCEGESLFSAGCDKLVNKPIRPDQLKRVVSRLLNGRTLKANA
jgi:CheY-like chemotaxis protein